ncbi:hypothetical protein HK413_10620 [Mucilaginibacter sp. S1162]|uniref:Secreted protein n=1 Tax=Mucilaginibacter humi TaxID=2732510 RepID=A0ABX1W1P9_9SPHI|nr:hypothetical protein [Mucilaginibacter humi]NNU34152.1 hypothetical protein [Mucilaginibacter humi]NNU34461.1 hypothetical protein [Mucilaginibacter humi]
MLASKVKFLLFIAMLMFVAKPFLGFSLRCQRYFKAQQPCSQNILVKSFAKRKLEFNENSEYNPAKMKAKLANPGLPVVTLLLLPYVQYCHWYCGK